MYIYIYVYICTIYTRTNTCTCNICTQYSNAYSWKHTSMRRGKLLALRTDKPTLSSGRSDRDFPPFHIFPAKINNSLAQVRELRFYTFRNFGKQISGSITCFSAGSQDAYSHIQISENRDRDAYQRESALCARSAL